MEKLGLILNFVGTLVIWIDAFVLSSYIAPNQIILRGDSGCKILIGKFFLHIGLLLVVAGFLLQLLAYEDDSQASNYPGTRQQAPGNQEAPNSPIDNVPSGGQSNVVPAPPANP